MSLDQSQIVDYDVPVFADYLPSVFDPQKAVKPSKHIKVQTYAQQKLRDQQRAQALINRLAGHINGKIEMSPTQIMAAKIVLAKCLPDLKAVEHSGEVKTSVTFTIEK